MAVLEAFQVSRTRHEMSPQLKQLPLPPPGGLTLPHYLHTEAGALGAAVMRTLGNKK